MSIRPKTSEVAPLHRACPGGLTAYAPFLSAPKTQPRVVHKPAGHRGRPGGVACWIRSLSGLVSVTVAAMTAGCGQPATTPSTQASNATSATATAGAELLLNEQPANAKPVAEVRESAKDGVDVTILGRIGGSQNPWVDGRAAFTIVDPKLDPCGEDEGCPTPWDYCCSTDQLPDNRAMIKFVDAAGDTLEQDARQLLGVKELQTVVVKGTAKRDETGNLTVLANSVFVMPQTK